MKHNKIILSLLIAFSVFACKEEASLTPSLVDVDRVATQVDLSKPLVKQMFENYSCGILYDFDFTLDFAYTAASRSEAAKWKQVEIEKLAAADVDYALDFLNENVFQYFKESINFNGEEYNSAAILDYLPYKVLVCDEISTPSVGLMDMLDNSDSRATENGEGVLHSLGNDHSFVFGVNRTVVENSTQRYSEYRNDNFFLFLTYIMDTHALYDQLPQSFYDYSSAYFDTNIGESYEEEGNEVDVYGLVDKNWFFEKGFIDARYFYNTPGGLTDVAVEGQTIKKAIKSGYDFVEDKRMFAYSYLNELIHTDSETLANYPEYIKEKLQILTETLMDWGIDIVSFNPDLATLYN
ncbi:hypothetical protein [Maribellus sediminis]|uniref:hypothetical protein n=1 Tax=Maribellus sediminis TaxID=2696285 RepID=UPI00143202A9|nr:hypothetical protein [Maribellus sediminis]